MMRRLLATLGAVTIVAACGGASTVGDDGGPADGAVAADGNASDGTTTDAVPSSDGGGADATSDAAQCAVCRPDFCGCGQCSNEQVVCTKTPKPCPLDCASTCDLKPYTCGCAADRCIRLSPAPPQIVPCYTTLDCLPGNCCMPRSGVLQGACVAGSNCP